jgi:hypothetical protein
MITCTPHRKTTAFPHMWVAADRTATCGPAPDLTAGALTS